MTETLARVPIFIGTINAQFVQFCCAHKQHPFMEVLRTSGHIKITKLYKKTMGVTY